MASYVFRYKNDDEEPQDVPVNLDMEGQTVQFEWPSTCERQAKKVIFNLKWVGDVMKGVSLPLSSTSSLGVVDEVEISSMSEVSYRCQGSGVVYQGNLFFVASR